MISLKRKHLYLAAALLFGFLFLANHGFAAEKKFHIVYPAEKSAVVNDQLRIVGVVETGLSEVSLVIKGNKASKTEKVAVIDNAFQYLLHLSTGKTVVQLLDNKGKEVDAVSILQVSSLEKGVPDDFAPYYLHSKKNYTENCKDCHLVILRKTPNYTYIDQKISCVTDECHQQRGEAKFVHGPVQEGECISCHNPHGSKTKLFLKSTKAVDICYSCHDTEKYAFEEGKPHFPITQGDCLSCHEAHQSNFEFHLKRESIKELCAACHGYERLEHEYMHDPAESEDCIACHSPHTSEYDNLIYEDGNEMCFTCHEVRKEEFESKYIHKPVKESCNLCHDPHGSNMPFHLRTKMDEKGKYIKYDKPFMESCLVCHRKLNPELVKVIEKSKVTHKPVVEGKCTICHTPHSTNFPKQLKANAADVCFSCHKDTKDEIQSAKFKHGPVKTNDCYQCHISHGSAYPKLLRDYFSQKFYSKFNLKNYKLCFNCHSQDIVMVENSVNTGFRNGDRNLHFEHVNRDKKGRNCITCHDMHASDQEKHIRTKIPYRKRFSISLQYTNSDNGGGCVVGCHKPRDYDRKNPVKYPKR